MPKTMQTKKCRAQHYNWWMVEPVWFANAVASVKNGTLKAMDSEDGGGWVPYTVDGGIATISLDGPLMKGWSKYGGTSTVDTRDAVRKAVKDESVKAIILHIDSPGGTVAGTSELAADVRAANEAKPVFAHVEDTCASAAYWIASQTRNIQATDTSEVGSIGVVMQLADTSGAYEKEGITVHTLSTGPYKGAGFDGAPVTEEHLAYFQERLNDIYGHFLNAVKSGRGMSIENVRSAANGKVYGAAAARDMGLIDGIGSLDDTRAMVQKVVAAIELTRAKALVAGENKGAEEKTEVIVSKSLTPTDSAKSALRQRFGLPSSQEVGLAHCGLEFKSAADARALPQERVGDAHWFMARITSEDLDRDGEVLIPQGMVGSDFEKSGAIFWNHDYDLPVAAAIGKLSRGEKGWVSEGRFAERPADYVGEFYPDYVRALVTQGIVKGVSVGFMPIESRRPTDKDVQLYGQGVKRVHSKWRLLEWSFAPIQSNVEAVVLDAVRKGFVSPAAALDMFAGVFSEDSAEVLLSVPFTPAAFLAGLGTKGAPVGAKAGNAPESGRSGKTGGTPTTAVEPERVVVFVNAPKPPEPERVSVLQVTIERTAKARGRFSA